MSSLLAATEAAAGGHTELIVAAMLLAVSVLVTLARRLSIPYPIFLVVAGVGISAIPGVPRVSIDPDVVLLIFLPPLLYSAAFFTDLRAFKRNLDSISMLAVGLVLVTTLTVGVVAHELVPGLSWAAAFTLGAILGPTDPVAATAMAGRLGLPSRVVVVAEGESLINDATALVAYKVAIAAVLTGSFSMLDASGRFVLTAAGGLAIGLAIGWVVTQARSRIDDPPVEITISLATGFLAYLPAEELGASGVIAAVSAGLFLGFRAARLQNAQTRIQAFAVWEIVTFLLNSALFLLIGLQLPRILDQLESAQTDDLIAYGLVISAVVIGVRIVFTFVLTYLPYALWPRLRKLSPKPAPGNVGVVAWMGMRGAVSLAAALAVPVETDAGTPFPGRDAILLITFVVILVTLVLQGLSLPYVARLLGVEPDEDDGAEDRARLAAAEAALGRIEALGGETWTLDSSLDRARQMYAYRHRRFSALVDGGGEDDDGYEERATHWVRLMGEIIAAQRDAIYEMRARGEIDDATTRRIERDLDLEEARYLEAR